MGKLFSGYSADTSPTTDDEIAGKDTTTGLNKRWTVANLITTIFNNIPTGNPSPVTRFDESFYDFVASGGVWSGDSYGVNRNASMTAMICYINGRRLSISAVTARTFTASVDTYIDVLDNQDGTGTLVYTEVANNAASPALASNSIRIGIIVTGVSSIAAVGSVNQGEENKILPIASSIPYAVTDSLGNLICNRNPNPTLLGYRQDVGNFSTTTTPTIVDVTKLAVPFIAPGNRKVRTTVHAGGIKSSGAAGTDVALMIRESSTTLQAMVLDQAVANYYAPAIIKLVNTPSAGLHTYKASVAQSAAGTLTFPSSGSPGVAAQGASFIQVELV